MDAKDEKSEEYGPYKVTGKMEIKLYLDVTLNVTRNADSGDEAKKLVAKEVYQEVESLIPLMTGELAGVEGVNYTVEVDDEPGFFDYQARLLHPTEVMESLPRNVAPKLPGM